MADPLGVALALDAAWDVADPTWTRIDTLSGCRVQDWSIDRGRANEFEKTGTGTATVTIIDREGLFDPTNASSPYVGKLTPGKQAAIALQNPIGDAWHTLFRGFVESWWYRLDQTRQYMTLELELVDGFAFLSRMELMPETHGHALGDHIAEGNVYYIETFQIGEDLGPVEVRLIAILDDVGWPDELRDLFSGNVRLREKVYGPGTSALAALQDAADGEFPGVANLYIDKTGVLTFHGRQPRFRPDVAEYEIQERDVGDPSATSLDPDVVPIAELEWVSDNSNLINQCVAIPEDIDLDRSQVNGQVVRDTTSIAAYGLRSLTFENLQTIEGLTEGTTALEETRLFAEYYVENYKTPVPRISRMVFKSRRPGDTLGPALWEHLCKCEISDLLNVTTEHPGGGGFSQSYFVEGLHYVGRPLNPDYHDIRLILDVSPQAHWTTNPFDADPDPEPA